MHIIYTSSVGRKLNTFLDFVDVFVFFVTSSASSSSLSLSNCSELFARLNRNGLSDPATYTSTTFDN